MTMPAPARPLDLGYPIPLAVGWRALASGWGLDAALLLALLLAG